MATATNMASSIDHSPLAPAIRFKRNELDSRLKYGSCLFESRWRQQSISGTDSIIHGCQWQWLTSPSSQVKT